MTSNSAINNTAAGYNIGDNGGTKNPGNKARNACKS